jgi:polyphosphate kinase 2 (PPK2 family)
MSKDKKNKSKRNHDVNNSNSGKKEELNKKTYNKELAKLQTELVKLQEWIKKEGLKVVVIFEGGTLRERAVR